MEMGRCVTSPLEPAYQHLSTVPPVVPLPLPLLLIVHCFWSVQKYPPFQNSRNSVHAQQLIPGANKLFEKHLGVSLGASSAHVLSINKQPSVVLSSRNRAFQGIYTIIQFLANVYFHYSVCSMHDLGCGYILACSPSYILTSGPRSEAAGGGWEALCSSGRVEQWRCLLVSEPCTNVLKDPTALIVSCCQLKGTAVSKAHTQATRHSIPHTIFNYSQLMLALPRYA